VICVLGVFCKIAFFGQRCQDRKPALPGKLPLVPNNGSYHGSELIAGRQEQSRWEMGFTIKDWPEKIVPIFVPTPRIAALCAIA
jgi:hypothetical protein